MGNTHTSATLSHIKQYAAMNLFLLWFWFRFRVRNRFHVLHRERLPRLQPGDAPACWHMGTTDSFLVGQLWFPSSLFRGTRMLPWNIPQFGHFAGERETFNELLALLKCISVSKADDTDRKNALSDLRRIKAALAVEPLMFFPSATRIRDGFPTPLPPSGSGSLARTKEITRLIPIALSNPAQPYRHDPKDLSQTLQAWLDAWLRRTAAHDGTPGKIAKICIMLDWALGTTHGTDVYLVIGDPISPEELDARANALREERAARGEDCSLNQCAADVLMSILEKLREEIPA